MLTGRTAWINLKLKSKIFSDRTISAINFLTCPVGRVSLLLSQDEPGEGHAVGVHRLHGGHGDAALRS